MILQPYEDDWYLILRLLDEEQGGEEAGKWEEMEGPIYMLWSMNESQTLPVKILDGYILLMIVSGES